MRKLASAQYISSLTPIPGCDKIELAKVLGWNVVVKKGDFRVNDLCVYFEIDSILPERSEFEFLRSKGFRVKTIKMRGVYSQGLCMPLSILDTESNDGGYTYPSEYAVEGMDFTECLRVTKYEAQDEISFTGKISNWPVFLPKTDEPRIQSNTHFLTEMNNMDCYMTVKRDGTSFTAYANNGKFGICSRKTELGEDKDNVYWLVANKLGLKDKMLSLGKNIAFQGELLGPKIQGNKYKLTDYQVDFFNVWSIDGMKYVNWPTAHSLLCSLELNTVPVLKHWFKLNSSVESLIELSKGIDNGVPREGIVIRSIEEGLTSKGERRSFKVINPEFLVKYE